MNGATRSAAAAPKAAPPRFSHRQRSERARPEWPDADPGVLTRVSARFAVRSARLLGGPILDWRAGGPNAAQPELKPSALSMYGWIPVIARKGFSGGAPSLHASPQSQPRIPGFGRILVGFPSGRIAAPRNDRLARLLTLTVSLNLGTICRCNSRFWTKFRTSRRSPPGPESGKSPGCAGFMAEAGDANAKGSPASAWRMALSILLKYTGMKSPDLGARNSKSST